MDKDAIVLGASTRNLGRAIWDKRLHEHGWLHLETPVHGMPIISGLFTLAESNADAKPDVIANVILAHTRTTPETKTQADTILTQVSQQCDSQRKNHNILLTCSVKTQYLVWADGAPTGQVGAEKGIRCESGTAPQR